MKRWIVIGLLAASVGLNAWFLWPRDPAPAGAEVRVLEKRGPSLPSVGIDFEGTPLPDAAWKLDAKDVESAFRDAPLEWRDQLLPASVPQGMKRAGGIRSINVPRSPRMQSGIHPLRHSEPPALKLQRAVNEPATKSLF